MGMIIRLFRTMTRQSFQSMFRSKNMSLASIGSVGATLVILGLILALILNMNNITNTTKDQYDKIQVYIEDGLNLKQTEDIGRAIEGIKGVVDVTYETKDKALEKMKDRLEKNGNVLDGLEKNPFPNSYIISMENIEDADSIANDLKDIKGIEDIKYYRDIIERLINISNSVRLGGFILIVVLVLISIFIISNTIKITVVARQQEISIMKYVGATDGFIRGPFAIEGVVLGLIGSILSILIVLYGYKYIYSMLNKNLYEVFTVYMIPPQAIIKDIIIIFIAIGVGIGMMGSVLSLRRFLKV